ncbi:MAG: hypothetical protein ACI82N_000588 [Maricaulis sp.]|jgi:hypothetical protein
MNLENYDGARGEVGASLGQALAPRRSPKEEVEGYRSQLWTQSTCRYRAIM